MAYDTDANGIPILGPQSLLSDVPDYTEALVQSLATILPIGLIQPFAGRFNQSSMGCWRLCDGLEVPDVPEYLALRTLLYNAHSSYKTPDLRGRAPIGLGVEGSTTNPVNYDTLLKKYGDQRIPKHDHGITDPGHGHTHTYHYAQGPAFGATSLAGAAGHWTGQFPGQAVDAAKTNISVNNSGDGTQANVPPSLAVNFIILAAYRSPATP